MIVPLDADPGVRVCSQAWAEALREGGLDVIETELADASGTATAVLVAPHAALRPLADDPLAIARLLGRSVCISTSRLGSGALGADRPFHEAAAASVALSRDSSRYLSAHGIATRHLAPGSHPRLRAERPAERSVAVGAHARYSLYRDQVLARSREALDPYACDLRVSRSSEPQPPGQLAAGEWLPWLTSLDVLVALPAEPGPGTDWCEVAPAVMNGVVVLTTAESDFGPLAPGEDLVCATASSFGDSLRRLLGDDRRRERIRASALARLTQSPLDVTPLADAIEAVTGAAHRARPYTVPAPAVPAVAHAPAEDLPAAMAAADAARARRVAAASGAADAVTTTSGWNTTVPAVSIVIPSHDQAGFLADAVESALAGCDIEVEVVVIDDRSADGSADLARMLLVAHDDRALKLVEHGDNAGLAAARNRGFAEARAPSVLLLDADDTLLPHAPASLAAALEADAAAAFAYGFVARSGPEGDALLGTAPWDPALFRHGNYIPVSCSLVRRTAWQRAGGYSADGLLELGWEDMDFWLRLAEAGEHGVQVRRIVGSYRVHGDSMSTVTNVHAAALMAFMRERHPDLMGADGV